MRDRGVRASIAFRSIKTELDHWLPVGRGLAACPIPWPDAEAADPMNLAPARGAVEHERLELLLHVGLDGEKLLAERLGLDGDWVRSVDAGGERLVDQRVGLACLLRDRGDGTFEKARARGEQSA
jgi:hypothetical protein